MHIITRAVAYVWLGIVAILAGAALTGVAALGGLRNALLADGSIGAPLALIAIGTFAYAAVAFRLSSTRREREEAAIIAEKPSLARDKARLKRELRIRAKEARIRRQESRTLKRQKVASHREKAAARREDEAERRREQLEAQLEEIRERRSAGR